MPKFIRYFWLLAMIHGMPSSPQTITGGTILISEATRTDIVWAADSRSTDEAPAATTQGDASCKLAVLPGGLIAGMTGFSQASSDIFTFHVIDLARAFNPDSTPRTPDNLKKQVEIWADALLAVLENEAQHNPGWQRYAEPGHIVSTLHLSSLDTEGHVMIVSSVILRSPVATSAPFFEKQTAIIQPQAVKYSLALTAGSGSAVERELEEQTTPRAKQHWGTLNRMIHATNTREVINVTYEFVKLAGEWQPQNIGGETDQIHLGPNGIEWIHRKKSCPALSPP